MLALLLFQTVHCGRAGSVLAAGLPLDNILDLRRLISFRLRLDGVEFIVRDSETMEPIENATISGIVHSASRTEVELRTGRDGRAFLRLSSENHEIDVTVRAPGYDPKRVRATVNPRENRRVEVLLYYNPFEIWVDRRELGFDESQQWREREVRTGQYVWEYTWENEGLVTPAVKAANENKRNWRFERVWTADAYRYEIVGYRESESYRWVKVGSNQTYYASFGEFYGYNVGSEFYPDSDSRTKYVVREKRIESVESATLTLYYFTVPPSGYYYPPFVSGGDRDLAATGKNPGVLSASSSITLSTNSWGDSLCMIAKISMEARESKHNWTKFSGEATYRIYPEHLNSSYRFSDGWRFSKVMLGSSVVAAPGVETGSSVSVLDYGDTWSDPSSATVFPTSGPVSFFAVYGDDPKKKEDTPCVQAKYKTLTVHLKKIRYVFIVDIYYWTVEKERVPVRDWVYKGNLVFESVPENTAEWRYESVREMYRAKRKHAYAYENVLYVHERVPFSGQDVNLYVRRLNGYTGPMYIGGLVSPENSVVASIVENEIGENGNLIRLKLRMVPDFEVGTKKVSLSVRDGENSWRRLRWDNVAVRVFSRYARPENSWALRYDGSVAVSPDLEIPESPPQPGVFIRPRERKTNVKLMINVHTVFIDRVRLISLSPFLLPPPDPFWDTVSSYILYQWLRSTEVREEASYVSKGYTAYARFDVPKGALFWARVQRVSGNEHATISWKVVGENQDTTTYEVTVTQPEYVSSSARSDFGYTVQVYVETGTGMTSTSFNVSVKVDVNPIQRRDRVITL